MSEYQIGVTAPPFHPWCRGTTAPYFADMEGIGERWARDANGKAYEVPKDMTYRQWKQKYVDNAEKSGIIKSIRIEDVKAAVKGGTIKEEVAAKIYEVLEKHNATTLFDKISVKKLGNNIVFQTEPQKVGTFFDTVFVLNEDILGGKTIADIDAMFSAVNNTVANNIDDAVVHEMYHAKLIYNLNYAQLVNLYDEMSDIHIDGISSTALADGAECIAESGVLIERGEKTALPKAAIDLFERFFG